MLVLEASSLKSCGSLARNVRFGSLSLEKLRKPRAKCSFWKLLYLSSSTGVVLSSTFGGGVFVFVWCCLCGGVFVVVFVWWCFCGVFEVVFVWWCFCGGVCVVVLLWRCFLWRCFCGGVFVVVFLRWCFFVVVFFRGGVFEVVFFRGGVFVGKESCVGKCCRGVLKECCEGVLWRSG